MSLGLTMPSLSLAADSILMGSLAMRRISLCKAVLERRIVAISDLIRLYSMVEAFSSCLDRRITDEHIPKIAISIIARKIHDGNKRNP